MLADFVYDGARDHRPVPDHLRGMTLLLAALAVVAGLVVLERAAEAFTDAVGGLAHRFRASEGTVDF